MKKKLLVLVMVTVLSIFSIVGCGKSDETNKATTGENSAETNTDNTNHEKDKPKDLPVITFYHGYFQDDWQPAVELRKIYDEFAELHKDEFIFKPIAMETGGEGVYNKCTQEIGLGKFPDIVDVAGWNVVPVASEADLIIDLKPYIDEDSHFKEGIGVNYYQNNLNGKIYTVRDQVETIGFWYNEDLFKKAGADTPDKWDTWDDFSKAVDLLNASSEVETPFVLSQGWTTDLLFTGHVMATEEGREMLLNPVSNFEKNAFIDSLNFLKDESLAKINTENFIPANSDKYREDFFAGKSAMLFNGVWDAGSFVGDNVTVDVANFKPAVFPTNESGKRAALVSASPGYLIAKNQDQAKIDACIEFIKYMTSKEVAEKILTKALAMPPSTTVDYDKYENSDDVVLSKLAKACKLASNADYQMKTIGAYWGEDISAGISGKYAGLKDGSKSVDDVISELNQLLQ